MTEATATSIDGGTFSFHAPVDGLELQPGSYASVGEHLGQVHTVELMAEERGSVHGQGMLLEGGVAPFHDVAIARADEARVAAWLEETRPRRAGLDIGELTTEHGVRFLLDAGGFDRHTFFCGQSAPARRYALGACSSSCCSRPALRIVVLDPNSDFVRIDSVARRRRRRVAERCASVAGGIEVRTGAGERRLCVRLSELSRERAGRGAAARPGRRPRGARGARRRWSRTSGRRRSRRPDGRLRAADPERGAGDADPQPRHRPLGRLAPTPATSGSLAGSAPRDGPRCLVLDLGSLATPEEQAIGAESGAGRAVAAPGRARAGADRHRRGAQRLSPRARATRSTALATERAAQIAAEGRKFGLYLLVSTQRPQSVNELVVSQCDNLVLMRMSSAADLAYLAETMSFAPGALVDGRERSGPARRSSSGKVASHPAFVRFGPRIAEEGGGDVPSSWADAGTP